ncbi:hypothetical protein CMI37_26880 [Candidatus Pacearchaeota archaeon]|nr:hypothetical protein [Candidatus Pacearchaeota archaeon]|tara:strand:- start:435 stop:854 length:420 start_codon:yes stop_codon:yes gene_type:complete
MVGEFFKLNDSYKIFLFIFFSFVFLRNYFVLSFYKSHLSILKIGYPAVMIIMSYLYACMLIWGFQYFERYRLRQKGKNKKAIDGEIKEKTKNATIVGLMIFIFFFVAALITSFNWLYSFVAGIMGMIAGWIIVRMRKKK